VVILISVACKNKVFTKGGNLQYDSLRGDPGFVRINHGTIYRLKQSLARTCLCRCVDNWVTEDVEIGFSVSGDTGRHDAPSSRMLQPAWQQGSQSKGSGAERAGGHRVSVAIAVLSSFIFISKLLRNL
jgi:hypothetical protein